MINAPLRPSTSLLDIGGYRGLSEAEAEARLLADGANELPTQKQRTLLGTVLEVIREPMFIMLLAAGSLYLLMGDRSDAAVLLASVLLVVAITIVQQRRTERALDALRDLSSPRALVIRDGVQRRIAGRDVVRGDVIVLAEGDRVPADGLLRRGINVSVDESLLTGESVPVRKAPDPIGDVLQPPGGDDLATVFSGTLVTSGHGVVEALATGARSQLGQIGRALEAVEPEPTPLQRETTRLVRTFAVVGVAACLVVIVAYALTRGGGPAEWRDGLLAGIAMSMATIPEEFPVVLTVFLALGAWRMSRRRVLTRRMPVIETLGAATVLCVDKTGTLTQNQMILRTLRAAGASVDVVAVDTELPEDVHELLEYAILASERDPFDPMERALHAAGERLLAGSVHLHPEWSLAREYPLASGLLAMSHVWQTGDGGVAVVASKGAPEAIADLCHLTPGERDELARHVATLAARGLRVIAVARSAAADTVLPESHHAFDFELVGLLGFEDPLRSGIPAAVAECHAAGVRVVMITGDYPATAQAIARQAGLSNPQAVITGPELDRMTDAELARRIGDVQVFARAVPEQKLRLVKALKARGEIVAMTGDGVNDAPALKAAHIGIAMGERGTDVAREAASLVLLDDDFSSIVAAVRLGRRIFDNIRKAVAFILAVHVPIAGLSMIPVFFGDWPLLLLPVHIVFLELIIDPSCTLVFEGEPEEADIMRRPPRRPGERLVGGRTSALAILQGVSVLAASMAVFLLARGEHAAAAARALTFAALVVGSLVIIVVNRSWERPFTAMLRVSNAAFRWVIGGTLLLLAIVLFVPPAQRLFHFAPLHPDDLALSVAAGVACVLWFEALKRYWRRAPRRS